MVGTLELSDVAAGGPAAALSLFVWADGVWITHVMIARKPPKARMILLITISPNRSSRVDVRAVY